MNLRKVTAATLMTGARTHALDKSVLLRTKIAYDELQHKLLTKKVKAELLYKKQCNEADKIQQTKGINPSTWTVGEIKKMIRPVKLKTDAPLPKNPKKEQLLIYYATLMHRQRRPVDEELLRDSDALMVGEEVEEEAVIDDGGGVDIEALDIEAEEPVMGRLHDL
jgi:hypothetical protein